ncbi:hypothetical protein CGRA01v4_10258 [Colletotrichum graminicola]|nr:hypothetical protein CGRA01v4_10258 [Colletotrichum graminicola]
MPANFIAGFSELNIATIEVLLRGCINRHFGAIQQETPMT